MKARIGFTGASGTGKSTLAEWLAAKHGLELNPIGSRSVSKAMGFASPYSVDAAGRRQEFQRRLLAEKRAWELGKDAFVTDRTTLDNLAYTVMHGVDAIDEAMLDSAIEGMRRYEHVIFCPVDAFCHPGDDPARVKDLTYHRIFESVLRGLIGLCERRGVLVPLRTLTMVGVDARKAHLDRIL